jgi:uncharacterized protein (DUF433 family)
MANVSCEHIVLDDNGIARIAGSRIKVNQLVLCKLLNGWGPEEIKTQYPHLSLAEIHAAFAYYYDHQTEIETEIERESKMADELEEQLSPSPTAAKLRAMGKLP